MLQIQASLQRKVQIDFLHSCVRLDVMCRFQKELKRKKIPLEEYAILGEFFEAYLLCR